MDVFALASSLGVVLLVLCAVLMVYRRVRAPPFEVRDSMPLADYLDDMSHTGDIIFFRSPKADLLHRLVSPLTHVALVVMHGVTGEPYVVEIHDKDTVRGQPPGVHCYPARQRLGDFKGELVVVPVRAPLSSTKVMRVYDTLLDVPYHPNVRPHVAKCKLWPPHKRSPPSGLLCSEFVAYILRSLGVMRGEWKCLTPSDLMHRATCSDAFRLPCVLTRHDGACHAM